MEARSAKAKTCAFTNQRAGWGKRHRAGECALTRAVLDGAKPDDESKLVATYCAKCNKTMCVCCLCCMADKLDDIGDVEREVPGLIGVMREWLRNYKTVDGKPPNTFGLHERAMDRAYAVQTVEETHQFWKQLVSKGQKTV